MVHHAKVVEETIHIPKMKILRLNIRLIGDSPLICHAWSHKAKKMMLDKQMKRAQGGREAKSPEQDFLESLYWCSDKPEHPTLDDIRGAVFGFPAIAFKAAAVDACSHVSGVTKVVARGAFHIEGRLIPIEGEPRPREDMVRIAMGVADIRYRAEFDPWRCTLPIMHNANVISAEQIVNLFQVAGFAIGIGEHRPQKNGQNGRFHVATVDEMEARNDISVS